MNFLLRILPWKRGLILSALILALLIILNFYGLYTNTFYFFKFDNYLFPLISLIHFAFLYVLWFKLTEDEVTDIQMRNLEFGLYVLLPIYAYKFYDSITILMTSETFESYVIPATFMPVGIVIAFLYTILILLTFMAFTYRKKFVGDYNFDEINRQVDTWE